MHIVFTIANNSSVPYFNWFAKQAALQKEHTFTFVALCKESPQMIKDVAEYGWDCYWIPFDHINRKKDLIPAFYKAYKLFLKLKPDVVHSHLFDDALPCLLAARLAGVKKRAIVKADTGFHYKYVPQWMFLDRFNNWNATDIIPPSTESEKFILDKEKANKNKVTMIHHGIPSEIYTKKSQEIKEKLILKYNLRGKVVVGTVSRLIDWKGYKYIIKAAKKVVKIHPNAIFLFVGEGGQKNELESLVRSEGLENNIIFTGWMDRDNIPSFYSLLDVYVHAASFEPFGFVIPEAMMNGIPIVSTPTGSALDVIEHKKNGYLTKYKDADSIAEGVLYAIEKGADFKGKGKQMALKKFEFQEMFNNYIKLYEN